MYICKFLLLITLICCLLPIHAYIHTCTCIYLNKGDTGSIYADINYVENKTGRSTTKEQLKKPFRITVTKSEVDIHYPLKYEAVSHTQLITAHVYLHCKYIDISLYV